MTKLLFIFNEILNENNGGKQIFFRARRIHQGPKLPEFTMRQSRPCCAKGQSKMLQTENLSGLNNFGTRNNFIFKAINF